MGLNPSLLNTTSREPPGVSSPGGIHKAQLTSGPSGLRHGITWFWPGLGGSDQTAGFSFTDEESQSYLSAANWVGLAVAGGLVGAGVRSRLGFWKEFWGCL